MARTAKKPSGRRRGTPQAGPASQDVAGRQTIQRDKTAAELAALLDSKLFKALCEPARVELIKFLIVNGRSTVGTIAERFPQDASVISRHLAILHDAGVVSRQKEGRHVYFQLDGASVIGRIEAILDRFRAAAPLCCPASDE